MDKNFVVGKLNEALSLEEAIVETETKIANKTKIRDLQAASEIAERDDQTHVVAYRRAITDMGGKVAPPPREARAWIEALLQDISAEPDELRRIGLYRILKFRAIATGELLDTVRRNLANPVAMETLLPVLRQDREHAARLAEIEARYAANEAVL